MEDIDDHMIDVARSKRELAILRKEELESEEEQDEMLIGHLDQKLVDLEREQNQLEKTQQSVKVK